MYKYFKLTKNLYWLLGVGGMLIIALLFFFLRSPACIRTFTVGALAEFGIFAGAMVAWMYGSDYAVEAVAIRKMRGVLDILVEECDPERFLGYTGKMRNVENKEVYTTYMALNHARGLLYAGRMQESYTIIRGIQTFTKGRKGRLNNLFYLELLAETQLGLHAYEEADKSLALFKEMLGKTKLAADKRSRMELEYEQLQIALDLRKGLHEGAAEKLQAIFNKAGHELHRVTAKYHLGKAYMHFGQTREAREAFQYVIDHGNKLHIVTEAKDTLAKLA